MAGDDSDLSTWYRSHSGSGLRVDLVGDYAGKELFAIHGEALLSHCLTEAKVDFNPGFQLLHAVHAVEKLLSSLETRGCRFHVLWFDDFEEVCVPAEKNKFALTRAVLVHHLNQSTTRPQISFRFPDREHPAFGQYVSSNAIQFMLLSNRCLDMLYQVHEWGYSIALIDDIAISSSKVIATVFSSTNAANKSLRSTAPTRTSTENTATQPASSWLDQVSTNEWAALFSGNGSLTLREAITAVVLTELEAQSGLAQRIIPAFALHTHYLRHCKLADRARLGTSISVRDPEYSTFLDRFCEICVRLLQELDHGAAHSYEWDLFDLVDGQMFYGILSTFQTVNKSGIEKLIEAEKRVAKRIATPRPAKDLQPTPSMTTTSVLPFNHPILDKFFQSFEPHISSSHGIPSEPSTDIFHEVSHWHNAKKKLVSRGHVKVADKWGLKKNQRYMAETLKYAASLTNAAGKCLDPETIILAKPSAKSITKTQTKKEIVQAQGQPKKAAWKQTSKQTAASTNKQGTKSATKPEVKSWTRGRKVLEKESDLDIRYADAVALESGLLSAEAKAVGIEVSLFICRILAGIIKPASSSEMAGQGAMTLFWARMIDLKTRDLTMEQVEEMHRLSKDVQESTECAQSKTAISSVKYQLTSLGPEMERSFDSAPDPRVPFEPDSWQRKVLDAIDDNKSLCVVAPTSAGKTFISFYAMKKVMQSSDDDVLVYVAPTKALVNQIAAEVQARFTKTFKHGGKSMWAIHTRDYRINNPVNCQILVTVPHILQIMLLSPSNVGWAKRVKRIIFDEVHCIAQADDGVIWEQLLLLAPCPIIALSATVGNPEEFNTWLVGSQQLKGIDMEMVIHTARYSDLRKYIWNPSSSSADAFEGFVEEGDGHQGHGLDGTLAGRTPFSFIHPIAAIVNRHRGTLDDISLEAHDCLTLWTSMVKHQNETFPVSKDLAPPNVLPATIEKADILKWEAALKACLLKWMAKPESPFDVVRSELQSGLDNRPRQYYYDERSEFSLLLDLKSLRGLPAIIFNYDRGLCESTLRSIMTQLKNAESQWKENSPEWANKMRRYEEWKKADSKRKPAAKPSDPKMSKLDRAREEGEGDTSAWKSFKPHAPLARFSFANAKLLSDSELEEHIWSLRWARLDPIFIEGLRRGVGVHHAGMHRKYRQVVEMLCRKGYLTVVVSTGTLALGINVPCRTVVFSGDSVFLSALNYRQASGRAGRRGFDLLGNVVFNLPAPRAMELMASRLPDLRGHFPVSTTLVLRLLGLCNSTNNSEYATNATQALLSQTRLFLGGPLGEDAVKHHLRFSIEYLRRQHLLSARGEPLNFAGLVGHLYFTENAVFAFHSLLKDEFFHELCAEIGNKPSQIIRELLMVLCHLFCRLPVHHYKNKDWLSKVHRSSSIALLPALPDAALAILRAHNFETLNIFKNYVQTYVCSHLANKPDDKLPFTGYHAGGTRSGASLKGFQTAAPRTIICSPFAALSGHSDASINSIHSLCSTVREGVFLEEFAVPYTPIYPDDTDGVPWNAYLYDFFQHGELQTLVTANGIKKGDVWFHLKDFSLILATIVTSLTNFLDPKKSEADADADILNLKDALDREEPDEELEADGKEEGLEMKAVAAALKDIPVKKAVKKKVADSWDDEDDSESDSPGVNTPLTGQTAGSSSMATPSWHGKDGKSLMNVLKAFKMLQAEFEEKFRKVWA